MSSKSADAHECQGMQIVPAPHNLHLDSQELRAVLIEHQDAISKSHYSHLTDHRRRHYSANFFPSSTPNDESTSLESIFARDPFGTANTSSPAIGTSISKLSHLIVAQIIVWRYEEASAVHGLAELWGHGGQWRKCKRRK